MIIIEECFYITLNGTIKPFHYEISCTENEKIDKINLLIKDSNGLVTDITNKSITLNENSKFYTTPRLSLLTEFTDNCKICLVVTKDNYLLVNSVETSLYTLRKSV